MADVATQETSVIAMYITIEVVFSLSCFGMTTGIVLDSSDGVPRAVFMGLDGEVELTIYGSMDPARVADEAALGAKPCMPRTRTRPF